MTLSVRKRVMFFSIMILIVFITFIASINYIILSSKVWYPSSAYIWQAFVSEIGYEIREMLGEEFERSMSFQGWNNAMRTVPMPFTSLHFYPNVRSETINTNDLGFRGTVNYEEQIRIAEKVHEEGGKIVVLTGGSGAFGAYSDSDDTDIVGHLNKMFARYGYNVRVFNYAMGSWTSNEELAVIVHWARDLNPDLVIDYTGFNDMARPFPEIYKQNLKLHYGFNQIRNSYPKRYKSEYMDKMLSEDIIDVILKNYEHNLRMLSDFLWARNSKLIIATQIIQGYENNVTEEIEMHYYPEVIKCYPRFIKMALNLSQERESTFFVNTAAALMDIHDAENKYIGDFMHLLSPGHEVVAEVLIPHAIDALGLPKTKSPSDKSRVNPRMLDYYFNHNVVEITGTEDYTKWKNGMHGATHKDDYINYETDNQAIEANFPVASSSIYLEKAVDLTRFTDGTISSTADYICLAVYIDSLEIADLSPGSITLVFYGNKTSNKYHYFPCSHLLPGWNYLKDVKSSFQGSGSWNIKRIEVQVGGAVPTDTTTFTFDNIQMIRKDPVISVPNPFQRKIDGSYKADYRQGRGKTMVLVKESGVFRAYTSPK